MEEIKLEDIEKSLEKIECQQYYLYTQQEEIQDTLTRQVELTHTIFDNSFWMIIVLCIIGFFIGLYLFIDGFKK